MTVPNIIPVSENNTRDNKRYNFSRSKRLLCHLMEKVGDNWKEISVVKSKIHKLDFMWSKRIYSISQDAIIIDNKGNAHYYVDINYTDGALRFSKSYIEKCIDCKKEIGIDSQNARDLLKRKTITAIWGVDNSHIMLLMILAIVVLVMGIAVMLMYAETQKLNAQIIKQSASLIMGINIYE